MRVLCWLNMTPYVLMCVNVKTSVEYAMFM